MVSYAEMCVRLMSATLKAMAVFVAELTDIRNELAASLEPATDRELSYLQADFESQLPPLLDLSEIPERPARPASSSKRPATSSPSRSASKRPAPPSPKGSYGQDPKRVRHVTPSVADQDENSEFMNGIMASFVYISGLNGNTEKTWDNFVVLAAEHSTLKKGSSLRTRFRTKLASKSDEEIKTLVREFRGEHPHIYNQIEDSWELHKDRVSKTPKKTSSCSKAKASNDENDIDPKEMYKMMKIMQGFKKRKVQFSDSDSD